MLQPGEVDHEIDLRQLISPPVPVWDAATAQRCALLYDRYVAAGKGEWIPDAAFCDLPRWVFLEYLVRFCEIRLTGSRRANLAELPPVVLSNNVSGWNAPRHYAFANSFEAIYRAVLDSSRLDTLGYPTRSLMRRRLPEGKGWGFYFGVDYRALPHAPWSPGTVYLYRRADFAPDYERAPFLASRPIRSLARVAVSPWDWPLLDRVQGADIAAQAARQEETFRGYPWVEDRLIHPKQGERPLAEAVRTYLEAHYAEPVDLRQLGKRFGMSPFALLRRFRAHMGISPQEFQTLLRITEAKRLLRGGGSIAQTAAGTGFCDQTHLTRTFRRMVGMTPGQYLRAQEAPFEEPVRRAGL